MKRHSVIDRLPSTRTLAQDLEKVQAGARDYQEISFSRAALKRLYQLTLSGFIGNSCRHLPTCSEYAHEAIARHGLWAGGWMGFFRVLRCGPFGTHGIDLVPEVLADRYVWFMPWRYWRIGRKGAETKA